MPWLNVFRKRRFECDLDDELAYDLDCRTEDNIRAGMEPAEARRRALLSLGGVERAKEECRDGRALAWLETIGQDLRYALRNLRRSPALSTVAVLSLAAGIGANSAIFSFIDAVFTRPMAVPRVSEIVHISTTSPDFPYAGVAGADYMDYRAAKSLSGVVAVDYRGPVLTIGGTAESAYAEVVSDDFFTVLEVKPALGRVFHEGDTSQPSIVLGHRFFEEKFGGNPRVIGKTVPMNGRMVTIVGVAPASFPGTRNMLAAKLWVPLSTWDDRRREIKDRKTPDYSVIGRLRAGFTVAQAEQELVGIATNLARAYPDTNKDRKLSLESDRVQRMRRAGPFSVMAIALVGAVLLLASMNVAILLLARAETRRHELAMRLALGAGKARLVRQLLTEASVLAVAGSVAGVALGSALTRIVPATRGLDLFLLNVDLRMDARVLLVTLVVSVGSGLVFGLVPALISARPDLAPVLKTVAAAAGTPAARARVRSALVTLQVAVSIVLITVSILLANSFRNALAADLGFKRDNMLVLEIPNLGQGGVRAARDAVPRGDCKGVERTRSSWRGSGDASADGPVGRRPFRENCGARISGRADGSANVRGRSGILLIAGRAGVARPRVRRT